MRPIIVTLNDDGDVVLTIRELQKYLDDAYNQGVEDILSRNVRIPNSGGSVISYPNPNLHITYGNGTGGNGSGSNLNYATYGDFIDADTTVDASSMREYITRVLDPAMSSHSASALQE